MYRTSYVGRWSEEISVFCISIWYITVLYIRLLTMVWENIVVEVHLRQTQPKNRADPTLTQYNVYSQGLLAVCVFKNLHPLRVYFVFTQGYFVFTQCLLLGSTISTKLWSRPVFYLTILSPVSPAPCIFQIHMKRLLSGVYSWVHYGFTSG